MRPAGVGDVAAAIRYAREQDLVIAVRGGGHSVPGLSTCDGGIVIDLSRMQGAEVDPAARVARVAGGSLLAELDTAAQAHDLVCPVGVVSHTGVAGLTLGGGMGRLQRRFGLTVDNVRAVELVTADGQRLRASHDEHPELFWGLRGAGANFGIATGFEFDLHPFDGVVTHGTLVHPIERMHELAAAFRELASSGPRSLSSNLSFARATPAADVPAAVAGQLAGFLTVLHSGSPADAERDLEEIRAFGPPLVDTVAVKRYVDVQRQSDEALAWGHRFYMKSAFVPSLPDALVSACMGHADALPAESDGEISVWTWGGAIADVPDEAMAFTGRDAAFWVSAEAFWGDPAADERNKAWGRAFAADLEPYATEGRYVNDVAETNGDLGDIYGSAKQERLIALKRAWDPDNVFRLNQNIRP